MPSNNLNALASSAILTQQTQRPVAPARKLIEEINHRRLILNAHKKENEFVRIHYAGAFGIMIAAEVSSVGSELINTVAKDEDGNLHAIIAHVSDCSFMLSIVAKTAKDPGDEKVVLGFGEEKPSSAEKLGKK